MSYKNNRRQEVLDGTKIWHKNEVCDGDDDIFLTEYVEPLRELRAEGLFEKLIEKEINQGGAPRILFVKIPGGINLEHRSEEEH